jgi:glycine cleavage system H lipoate-binding protein
VHNHDLHAIDATRPTHRLICAQVEGRNGTVQLESPIAGVVAARNEAIMEDPGLLARNAECVDGAWLVEVDGDADELEDLPERLPT